MPEPRKAHRVVIVGAGFAGFNAARELRRLGRATTEITVINSADYFLYLPLMPHVAGGLVEPRHIWRGVEVRTGQSVAAALDDRVQLSTGETVPTRSLIWCVGVRADPLVGGLDLATNRGRLVVDEFMAVPGADGRLAAAANPLHIPLSGPPANAVTRAYHLYAMAGNRTRVLADRALNAVAPPEATSFGEVSAESIPLDVNQPRA